MYKLEDDDSIWIQSDGDVLVSDLITIAEKVFGTSFDERPKLKIRTDSDEDGNGYFVLSLE